jgi:pilus assembly protein CpaB
LRRRLLAALAALVLAATGAVVLLAYVRGADARALAGVQTVDVLVVDRPVAEGTPGEALAELVRTERLPAKAAVPGAVTDLGELAGRVATVDLQPGEQLLAARFAVPEDLGVPGTVPAPEGAAEVSLLLEPQRAVGGRLEAGDTVGVVVSIGEGKETGDTGSVIHKVLVTEVQGAPVPGTEDSAESDETETASSGSAVPQQSLMITLAVTAAQAEAVVYGMEQGSVWLTLENEDAKTGGTEKLDAGNIYQKDF